MHCTFVLFASNVCMVFSFDVVVRSRLSPACRSSAPLARAPTSTCRSCIAQLNHRNSVCRTQRSDVLARSAFGRWVLFSAFQRAVPMRSCFVPPCASCCMCNHSFSTVACPNPSLSKAVVKDVFCAPFDSVCTFIPRICCGHCGCCILIAKRRSVVMLNSWNWPSYCARAILQKTQL
jgi:hypothetical protein